MAPWRLSGCRAHAVTALLLLLLVRPPATRGVTCPTPTSVEHADIHVRSYTLHSRERYVCSSGFKRKAGTSSLIECVHNKTTNAAHWTAPNLKCIRDPSLTHQRPVPPSTVEMAGVTPQPESLSPSGKEPAAASPRSDITVTTETAAAPGSRLMPSEPPSSGTTQIGSRESSKDPPQTTAETLGLIPSASSETPGASPFSSREVTAHFPREGQGSGAEPGDNMGRQFELAVSAGKGMFVPRSGTEQIAQPSRNVHSGMLAGQALGSLCKHANFPAAQC
ncbi:interleukin-15 receptor subunit alpha isoform X4 [Cynocephalus volans]|uniref:interleukin-15 receptor subunit alpha isoform X4 n=1 Tax=Cynocephalus volans TaxID=110931 RepID=UPI002FCC22E4